MAILLEGASEAEKVEADYWLRQAEAQFEDDVFARDKGICICGAPIEVVHHLLTRKKFRRFKSLPAEIRTVWTLEDWGAPFVFNPHIEINGRGLCLKHHMPLVHGFGKVMTKLLLMEILFRHRERFWRGRSYWDWYHLPPFVEYLS